MRPPRTQWRDLSVGRVVRADEAKRNAPARHRQVRSLRGEGAGADVDRIGRIPAVGIKAKGVGNVAAKVAERRARDDYVAERIRRDALATLQLKKREGDVAR